MDLIIVSIRSDRFDHEDQKTVICFYSTRVEPDLLILLFLAEINYHSFSIEIPRDGSSRMCTFSVYLHSLLLRQMPYGALFVSADVTGQSDWSG